MRVAPTNAPDAQEPDVDMPQRKLAADHRINLPLSQMGQEMDGIPRNDQDKVLRSSPETEGSLSLLGAGTSYRPTYLQGD
jgi:hypothetical protein